MGHPLSRPAVEPASIPSAPTLGSTSRVRVSWAARHLSQWRRDAIQGREKKDARPGVAEAERDRIEVTVAQFIERYAKTNTRKVHLARDGAESQQGDPAAMEGPRGQRDPPPRRRPAPRRHRQSWLGHHGQPGTCCCTTFLWLVRRAGRHRCLAMPISKDAVA